MQKMKYVIYIALIAVAVATRWLPHAPNFSPLIAISLFAGIYIKDRRLAIALPLVALLISDMILGFYNIMPAVYLSLAFIIFAAQNVRKSPLNMVMAGFSSSVFFFATTNFAVWLYGGLYPKTMEGLWACYVAALPFFHNTLVSTLLYGSLMMGAFSLFEKLSPQYVKVND